MVASDSFAEFLRDQLEPLGRIAAKRGRIAPKRAPRRTGR
jgi:hypothetical protein